MTTFADRCRDAAQACRKGAAEYREAGYHKLAEGAEAVAREAEQLLVFEEATQGGEAEPDE